MTFGRGYVINVGRGYVITDKGRHRAARAAKNKTDRTSYVEENVYELKSDSWRNAWETFSQKSANVNLRHIFVMIVLSEG